MLPWREASMSQTSVGLSPQQFRILTGSAVLALLLVTANVGLSLNNREAQLEVNNRQQFINQTVQLSRLNNEIVQALVNLSVQTGDEGIRDLLAAQGITFSVDAPEQQQ
jgi:hypothetical protein